jgi:urea transporter/murein DD-endopeptidase MepM/ murein hydrolase activator NlpD
MTFNPVRFFRSNVQSFSEGVLNSYAQVFFSQRKALAILLFLLTFIDFQAGLSGLIAVVVTQITARIMGMNAESIRTGLYSFNSLSVGLCLGVYYDFNTPFAALLVFAALLSLLLTVWIGGSMYPKGLPYLSFPFIFTIWAVLLASRSYDALNLSERGIYLYNELYRLGGQTLVDGFMRIENFPIPFQLGSYFRSMGAIFFQYNLMAGVLAAVALFIYSRIAFLFSIVGFYTGFLFYSFLGGNITELTYSFIGFNFILTSIALGGFFLIPSIWSFVLVMLVSPLIAVLNSSLTMALQVLQLPLYSMPFNIMVVLLLYMLKLRSHPKYLHLTPVQHYSPEINLYSFNTGTERFRNSTSVVFQLPYFGQWSLTQGHNGEHTHKGDWRHAFDFMLLDSEGKTWQNDGLELKDYFGWQKPVLAPADGLVVDLHANIEENPPGKVNLENNWGNSIVIKHGENLYSQISHLLTGSFRVSLGDYVKKGDIIALLGNSGRSPEPHIHFQLQRTPYVGSATIDFPLGYYLKKNGQLQTLVSFGTPEVGETIQNVEINPLLKEAYSFVPGQILKFKVEEGSKTSAVKWEVRVNIYNQAYLYCHQTKAVAYFLNNGTMFYFLSFHGNRKSLLYKFYLSSYQVLLGYYPDIILRDRLPVHTLNSGIPRLIQDLLAPFVRFLQVDYQLEYTDIDSVFNSRMMVLCSEIRMSSAGVGQNRYNFNIELKNNRIEVIRAKMGNQQTIATHLDEFNDTLPEH